MCGGSRQTPRAGAGAGAGGSDAGGAAVGQDGGLLLRGGCAELCPEQRERGLSVQQRFRVKYPFWVFTRKEPFGVLLKIHIFSAEKAKLHLGSNISFCVIIYYFLPFKIKMQRRSYCTEKY